MTEFFIIAIVSFLTSMWAFRQGVKHARRAEQAQAIITSLFMALGMKHAGAKPFLEECMEELMKAFDKKEFPPQTQLDVMNLFERLVKALAKHAKENEVKQ